MVLDYRPNGLKNRLVRFFKNEFPVILGLAIGLTLISALESRDRKINELEAKTKHHEYYKYMTYSTYIFLLLTFYDLTKGLFI